MPETLPAPAPHPHDPEVVRAAAEAAVWAHPALLGYRELRTELRTGVAALGVLDHDGAPPAPGDGTRHADPLLLRSSAWLDLRAEPAVVSQPDLPAGLYSGAQVVDLLGTTVAHLGAASTGRDAGDWVVAGPGWDGPVPPGVRGVLRPTSWLVRVITRTAVPGPDDLPAARVVQHGYRVRPLHALGGVTPPRPAPSVAWLPWDEERAWGAGFVDYLALLLRLARPTDPADRARVARWVRLGVLPGGPDGWGPRGQDARTRALVARGAALGAAQLEDALRRDGLGRGEAARSSAGGSGRGAAPGSADEPGAADGAGSAALRRAVAAEHELHAPEPDEVRTLRWRGLGGEPLDGHRRYRMTLPGPPPARLHWSLAAHAEPSGELVAHRARRYALGPGTPDLPWGRDGSLVVALQHDGPVDARAAWLPVPSGPFSLVLRLYAPVAATGDGPAWTPTLRALD
ncbi:DUF1254 domain-containing protein [Cellulomonas sp. IC4_254]|uniref:DUF1254 domain-containing protein n=1 Tax=Cellulomonas sp. IC4_254 TaxID=2714040 RepID=UPI00141DAE82|nr:DUF1254 domain-containing protein [Cellulomonas sp. IC4_254]NHT19110.1 DUF1254 domain-containing protein [Cellulomonas sp. IC4_254]